MVMAQSSQSTGVVPKHPVSSHAFVTPANAVTLLRIFLAPVLVLFIYLYAPAWWVLIFGFFALSTDKLDGYLARRYGTSALGTFLDPLADKIMILGSLAMLVVHDWISWIPFALIAGRELAMSWWRSKLLRAGISVPARRLAKLKMWAQSTTVAIALAPGVVTNASWLLTGALWFTVAITLYTFWQYMRDGQEFYAAAQRREV